MSYRRRRSTAKWGPLIAYLSAAILLAFALLAPTANSSPLRGRQPAAAPSAGAAPARAAAQTSSCPGLPAQGSFQGKTDFNTVKAQLWYNDGAWWGAFSDGLTGVAIHKQSGSTFVKGEIVDGNIAGKPDVLWNGTHLFVMVYKSGSFASFYKYSYSPATQTYTLLAGFPVNLFLDGNANILNIEQDGTGKIWAAYTGTLGAAGDGAVHVIYTASADHTVWDTGGHILHTGFTTGINAVEEVAAVVRFGGDKVGVAWSNQTGQKISFRYHVDGEPENAWSAEEVIDSGLGPQGFGGVADDHMSIKSAPDGRVFLVAKDDDEPAPGTGAHLHLYVRSAAGAWGQKTIVNPDFTSAPTRPVLLLDTANGTAYVFYRDTSPAAGNKIWMAQTNMDAPSFSTPCAFLDTISNNTTGTKQNLDQDTGLLMAASTGTLGGQVVFNTIDLPAPGFEGDVAPRPNGSGTGSVTISDWVLCGRFAAGLDTPAPGGEFQRADTAPRASSGGGTITISDWVQCGRYAAALDPVQGAGGPSSPPSGPTFASLDRFPALAMLPGSSLLPAILQATREVRVTGGNITAGQSGTVAVELVSQGDENGVGFSLTYDTSQLTFVAAANGGDAAAATLNVNQSQTGSGRLGVAVALPSGQSFAAGTRQLVVITFSAAAGAGGSTPVGFADQPVAREVADSVANVLPALFTPGAVNVTPQGNPAPSITTLSPSSAASGGPAFTLTVNGTNFLAGSIVRFDGDDRPTTFISATQLTAQVSAADVSAGGVFPVTVANPAPGGGVSNPVNFTVNNPAPAITGLSPASATAGGLPFTLTVNGSNFISGSVVNFGAAPRTTTFVSATQLTAQILASDIAAAGSPNVTVTNPGPGGGTSPAQTFTVNPSQPDSRAVRIVNVVGRPGDPVDVPVELVSQGDENAFGFSVTFDPAHLSFVSATQGADASTTVLNVNTSQAAGGRVGVAQSLPAGEAFVAGVRQLLVLRFNVKPDLAADSTGIGFGDLPIARELVSTNATHLAATFTGGVVTLTRGYEADVFPRSNGDNNGTVTIIDWNQVGRFAARLDEVSPGGPGGEFQRADCSPKETLGDGILQISDWVQAGRYAAQLDPAAHAGGPTSPAPLTAPPPFILAVAARDVRVANTTMTAGQQGTVSVELEAQGDENALGFSMTWDTTKLGYVSDAAGTGVAGATINFNRSQTGSGRLGVGLALPAGAVFPAGARQLVTVTFNVNAAASGTTPVGFGDQPIGREVVDAAANTLQSSFTAGTITINPAGSPAPTLTSLSPTSAVAGGTAFTLTVNGTNFVSTSVVRWNGADRTTTFVSATQLTAQIPAADLAAAGAFPVTVFNPAPGGGTSNTVNFAVNVTTPADTFQFSAASYAADEESAGLTITVTRSGNTAAGASVDYATADGSATERADYTTALGTLAFAPGETQKTFILLVTEDSKVEGAESLTVALSNPTGGVSLGSPSAATVNINDDASEPAANANDGTELFVRQHYHDFLNRDADAPGLAFWTSEIESCGPNPSCREVKRINVSAAFYLSIEFQETGFYVYRLYKSSLPPTAQRPEGMPRYHEFLRDTQRVGRGVVVLVGDWEQQLEQNRRDFAEEFVGRAEFAAQYPASMTPAQYVDALNTRAGGVLSTAERDALVAGLAGGAETRASALRRVADDADFRQQELNRAFVLMQYIGYLRRSPNDPPDTNLDGLNFWLSKLNQFGGNFIEAEMVKAFLDSLEYRGRFGQP